jgi:hypothetical protein
MMSRRRHSLLLTLSLLMLGMGYSARASADATGYVCQTAWTTNPGALASYLTHTGTYGLVYSYVYSQPNCQGSQLALAYFCTTGATNSTYCTLNQLMSETQAGNLATSLRAAGAAGQKITVYTSSGTAGVYVEFGQP